MRLKFRQRQVSVLGDHSFAGEDAAAGIALAFTGLVVPDQPAFASLAFNRAGNMFQENLLVALREAGLPASMILSQRPLRSFPHSRTLWSAGGRATLASGLDVHLVSFLNLPWLRPVTVGMAVVANLVRWGRQQRDVPCKVVITYNLTEPPGLFTLVGARLIRARAVAFVCDVNVPGETVPATLARRLDFWLQKRLIPRFDGLAVVNQRIIDDLAPHRPFVRLEGGVKAEVLRHYSDRPSPPQRTDGPFTIVSVGSLNETNGFLELLEAFSFLPGDGYRLRIAGTGPLEGRIAQAARADRRIEYCGYLAFEQILELYDTADVLVNMRLTQRLNTGYLFPSKTLEYLASGVPVITTCTGQITDEYAAMAFPLQDESPQGLARMIEHVASLDPEVRRQIGKVAQKYVQQRNTWERQGRRVADFVRSQVLGLC